MKSSLSNDAVVLGGRGGFAGNVNTTRRKNRQARPNSKYSRFIISLLILLTTLGYDGSLELTFNASISVTNLGPMTKLMAVPTYDASEATAVAVVRWCGGNHVLEMTVAEDWPTGPPSPITNCPIWINGVATSGSLEMMRRLQPMAMKAEHRITDIRRPRKKLATF